MADGQVLIDSKLDSGGVERGAKEIEKQFEKTAKAASRTAEIMERELKAVDLDGVADGMSESFDAEGQQIEQILEETASEAKENANEISNAYERAANDQSAAMKSAWNKTKSESASSSRKVVEDIDDIGDKAESVGGKISSGIGGALKSLAATAAVYFGAEEIIEAGLAAVQATADVRAENAQFEQTFKDLQSQATESLNTIADNAGITATRMKKAYTGIYAFSKSVGVEEADALDIANRAMTAAADSAAYYDRTLEDATETLQSFLKGNFENDAALGFAATETTRNAKANEKYAKSFDKLTEAQKVDVLLSMVEAANEASGALGQAAREADSWTNVTGELNEAWRQFQAVIGEPILDYVTPIIQNATVGLNALREQAKDFHWTDLFGDTDLAPMTQSISDFSSAASELAGTVGGGLKYAYENVLVPMGTWTIEKGLPSLLDAVSSSFGAIATALEWLGPLGEHIVTEFLQPLGNIAGMGIDAALDGIASGFDALSEALEDFEVDSVQIFDAILRAIQQTFTPGLGEPLIQAFNEVGSGAETAEGSIDSIGDATKNVSDAGSAAFGSLSNNMIDHMAKAYQGSAEQTAKIQEEIDAIQGKIIYIDILPRIGSAIMDSIIGSGGSPILPPSYSSYEPAAYSFTPQIPYLATGAVIPPNAPFLAVLGDQRSGTNIEAPLETIKQAVSDVLGDGEIETVVNLNFNGDLAQLGRILYPVIETETKRKGKNLMREGRK